MGSRGEDVVRLHCIYDLIYVEVYAMWFRPRGSKYFVHKTLILIVENHY